MLRTVTSLLVRSVVMIAGLATAPSSALAQDHTAQPPVADAPTGWRWQFDANTFVGFNYQYRKFRDFDTWESQNWLMASGERSAGKGRLRLNGMLSLEPFTLGEIGSPQVFQTGETYRGGAIIDYQHPHDLIMGLGGELRLPTSRADILLGADLVGSPSLGPPAFMHRPSAMENPQAPLAHHHLDATHITAGVIRAGIERGGWRVEGSWFQGREPDENRKDIDLGPLDSYALRLSWSRGPLSAQVSSGWLNEPERVTPFDAQRVTASLAFTRGDERRSIAWMAAFGQNREIHGNLEAYLFEATFRFRDRNAIYTRLESVDKDILDVGFHPVGTFHPHRQSRVGAATLGYVRDILRTRAGLFGVGGDITGYAVPFNLQEPYGSPVSFHAFVRYRLRPGHSAHVH